MSYRLVITEKPSVAQAYAKVLGATSRQDSYLEGGGYLVSWCVGHLVELAPPNLYDEKYPLGYFLVYMLIITGIRFIIPSTELKCQGTSCLFKSMHPREITSCPFTIVFIDGFRFCSI